MTVLKFFRITLFVILTAIALPASSASIVPDSSNSPATTETTRGQQLLQRLGEIKGMDKSDMTRLEKKALRKEVRDINKEMKAISGGVYLSVGAIIIVILLLILLL